MVIIRVFSYQHHCFYVVEPPTVQVRYLRGSSMCVAVPAEVLEIKEGNIGLVDYGDLKQEVRLDLVDVKIGEFVLVHVGFAIQRLSREEGLETREIFKQVYAALEG
jgi:hydrogenase expression/formation protein HypC